MIVKRIRKLAVIVLTAYAANAGAEGINALTVEGRLAAVGLETRHPRFGWQIETDAKNVMQKSYRIRVATSEDSIAAGVGDVWDSGTVVSDSSQWVSYRGDTLQPNTVYYWNVSVTTNKGKKYTSQTARWATGIMGQPAKASYWIGLVGYANDETYGKHPRIKAKYLRKTFSADKRVKRATLHICGVGNYVAYINGKRVGNDVLTPVPTEYKKKFAYDSYDVTALIEKNNAIGVALAAGHFTGYVQYYQEKVRTSYGVPRLIANLIIEYADGTEDDVVTDNTWKLHTDGPIVYAVGYDGEMYDARKEFGDWTTYAYNDSAWAQAQVLATRGILVGNITPNMHVYKTDSPVSMTRYGDRYIVDFGTNGAGRVRVHCHPEYGDTVRIRHAETLCDGDSTLYTANLRNAEATSYYISNGTETSYAPEFTFYGFRYVEVTGIPDLHASDLTRELIADRMDDEGTDFTLTDIGGNDMLDSIVANARRGIRSNYKGMPIDCPQRDERMPWLGDRTTGCFGESYLMNNHDLYAKWVKDICDSQRGDGKISDVSPAFWRLYHTNVTWPAALPFACDMLYRQYGDIRPMRNAYNSIKKFLAMIRKENYSGGIVQNDTYGDWCVPPESPELVFTKDSTRITDGKLLGSAYYYYICRMMSDYAQMFGDTADASYYAQEAETTLTAFNDTFLVDGQYSNGTATANLLPLAMGMVPEEMTQSVQDSLISTIVDENDSHVSVGVIGIQWLMRYLSDSGHGDIAYALATTDTYPGWGYMVKSGATTVWELWNGNTANPSMNSGNHVMLLGDLLVWCYERLAGIQPDRRAPGFKRVILAPDFSVASIGGVKASHPSPYGLIRSEWKRDGKKIAWTVTVPANTTAEVRLPGGKVKEIGSGTYSFNVKAESK